MAMRESCDIKYGASINMPSYVGGKLTTEGFLEFQDG